LSFGAVRRGKNGGFFCIFPAAAGKDSLEEMSTTVRQWLLHRLTISQLAREIDLVVRSWVCINYYLVRWRRKKYRRLRAWKKRT
jgi:hypothetical protein